MRSRIIARRTRQRVSRDICLEMGQGGPICLEEDGGEGWHKGQIGHNVGQVAVPVIKERLG